MLQELLTKSRELPKQCQYLPEKQKNGVKEWINKGYKFIHIHEVRGSYNRYYKYVILRDLAGNEVTINKNGNNRNMYGY